MKRQEVYSAIDSERDYQDAMSSREDRPDMVEDMQLGSILTAMRHNLQKAEAAWYASSAPHAEAMGFVRKVAALAVKAGETLEMPPRAA